jgi:hypothetical protein
MSRMRGMSKSMTMGHGSSSSSDGSDLRGVREGGDGGIAVAASLQKERRPAAAETVVAAAGRISCSSNSDDPLCFGWPSGFVTQDFGGP